MVKETQGAQSVIGKNTTIVTIFILSLISVNVTFAETPQKEISQTTNDDLFILKIDIENQIKELEGKLQDRSYEFHFTANNLQNQLKEYKKIIKIYDKRAETDAAIVIVLQFIAAIIAFITAYISFLTWGYHKTIKNTERVAIVWSTTQRLGVLMARIELGVLRSILSRESMDKDNSVCKSTDSPTVNVPIKEDPVTDAYQKALQIKWSLEEIRSEEKDVSIVGLCNRLIELLNGGFEKGEIWKDDVREYLNLLHNKILIGDANKQAVMNLLRTL